jgi:hypothetical protein
MENVARDHSHATSQFFAEFSSHAAQFLEPLSDPLHDLLVRRGILEVVEFEDGGSHYVDSEQTAVINGGNIVGVVTRDSIMRVVQTRNDLALITKHDPARELGEKLYGWIQKVWIGRAMGRCRASRIGHLYEE